MPKFVVYEPEKKVDEPTRLKLEIYKGQPTVIAVDKNGSKLPKGNIVCFREDGTMVKFYNVNESLGFKLEGNGKVETGFDD